MGEIVASALAQEGVSRASSFISTKLDDRASRARLVERLEWALYPMELALERTAKMPITCVSLLRCRKTLKSAYSEGIHLLNKHKLPEQVVVTSSSYVQRIVAIAAYFSLSSLASLNKQCLSSSDVQKFERHADRACEFLAHVESACPLRSDITFRYPFVRKLLEGKYLSYKRVKGSQKLSFEICPAILEGRGVEARVWYEYFDPERLEKSFSLVLALRLSESTDIVGAAIHCLRSSASLLNLVAAQDAVMGDHLTQLPNLQGISDSYAPPYVGFEDCYAFISEWSRPDPLCCQRNGHGTSSVDESTISSELSHFFQEQTIYFSFSCYVSALEYILPASTSGDEAATNILADRTPLKLDVSFDPHFNLLLDNFVSEYIDGSSDTEEGLPFGSLQQTVDMTRSRSVDCLIRQPEAKDYSVRWFSRHGYASFAVEKTRIRMSAVPNSSGRYNTRSSAAAKRKR